MTNTQTSPKSQIQFNEIRKMLKKHKEDICIPNGAHCCCITLKAIKEIINAK